MISFLIPIMSKSASRDWAGACQRLQCTLNSVYNSRNPSFEVVLVGHDRPPLDVVRDDRFRFVEADFDAPGPGASHTEGQHDKVRKVRMAMEEANSAADYWMQLDADDWISRNLIDWVDRQEPSDGFLLRTGWVWYKNFPRVIQWSERFFRDCGSCIVMRPSVAGIEGGFQEGIESTLLANSHHERLPEHFAEYGLDLVDVTFPAGVYRSGYSSSLSHWRFKRMNLRQRIGWLRRLRPLTRLLRAEFALW